MSRLRAIIMFTMVILIIGNLEIRKPILEISQVFLVSYM